MSIKNIIAALILTLGFWGQGHTVSATHLFGGEVKYQFLGANGSNPARPYRYRVTYLIYYNATGGPSIAPPNPGITVRFFTKPTTPGGLPIEIPNLNNNPGSPGSFVFNLQQGPLITPPVPAGCTVVIPQLVRLLKYEKVVELPPAIAGYYTVYSVAARNNGIRNLASSGSEPLTLFADMGPTFRFNNAPVFTDTAVAIVCSGDTATIINNATDPDGDRLIYSFNTPYGDFPQINPAFPPTPVTYANGFSVTQPFGAGGYAFLNASTGLTKYYIPTPGEYVVSLEIREFRNINGVEQLVGTSVRDIQLFVSGQCGTNASPRLSIPAASYNVQAGTTIPIKIKGTDGDSLSQPLTFSGELFGPDGLKIQDLTKITTNGTGIYTTINFNAPCNRPGTYTYNLRVKDLACPFPKTDPKTILINVQPFKGTRIQGDSVVCNGLVNKYFVTRPAGSNIANVNWNIASGTGTIIPGATADTVYVTWTGTGNGTLTSKFISTAGCLDSTSRPVTINQGTAPAFTGLGTTYCVTDGSVTLTGNSTTGTFSGSGIVTTGTGVTTFNPAAAGPGTHQVTYTVLTNTCRTTTTANVTVSATPVPNFGNMGFNYCADAAPVTLSAPGTTFLIDGVPATVLDPATLTLGNHNVTAVTINGGCSASSIRTVSILPVPTPSLAFLQNRYCANATPVSLATGSLMTYLLDGNPIVNGTINFSTLAPGPHVVSLTQTSALNCSATVTRTIIVDPAPLTDAISGAISVCPGLSGIRYSIVSPRETTYNWSLSAGHGTIVSGQGTTSILVNWGSTPASATVSAVPQNTQGCLGTAATLPVNITQVLATPQPVGPASICLNQATQVRYVMTNPTTGSTFTWSIPGATVNSNTRGDTVLVTYTAPGTHNIVVQESSTGSSATGPVNCFGNSTPFPVTILPSPDANLPLAGPASVCENAGNTAYTLTGAPAASTFAWSVTSNGVTTPLAGTGSTVQFNATTPGQYTISTTETNAAGCIGTPITKVVTVTPRPVLSQIQGPDYLCPDKLKGNLFFVSSTPGQTFTWSITGGTLASANGNDSIYADFAGTGTMEVSVTPVSPTGCPGTPLTRTLLLDAATLQLQAASTAEQNDKLVVLSLQMPGNSNNTKQIDVYRRSVGTTAFTKVASVNNTATSFTDNAVQTGAAAYEYYLESSNECGTVLKSNVHATMLLDVLANEEKREVYLRWNSYKGWSNVTGYEIYAQADNGSFEFLRRVGTADTIVTLSNISGKGFNQCFRIKALSADTRVSWSNAGCVSFENPLAFFNIFTPNNDQHNDKFVIENIGLYPGNELQVFNRWGNEIYKKKDYDNSWDGSSTADGTYYYLLRLKDGRSFKGWVEISR